MTFPDALDYAGWLGRTALILVSAFYGGLLTLLDLIAEN